MFVLHEKLAADTFFVTDSALSSVLLMNNALFPWLILAPRVQGAKEIIDLSATDQHVLMDEIAFASRVLQRIYTPHKLNVATLGNQVSALHVHVIARFEADPAWPNPVWGNARENYINNAKKQIDNIRELYNNK